MNRGDVCWYTFRAPDKKRPVLILTRDSAIYTMGTWLMLFFGSVQNDSVCRSRRPALPARIYRSPSSEKLTIESPATSRIAA